MPSTSGTVNKDLQAERDKCTFNNEEFTLWWVGGETKLKEKRFRGKRLGGMDSIESENGEGA